jgi:hypothetical protein
MLRNTLQTLLKRTVLFRPLGYYFSAGGHHEIDYNAVVTKNMKSGEYLMI